MGEQGDFNATWDPPTQVKNGDDLHTDWRTEPPVAFASGLDGQGWQSPPEPEGQGPATLLGRPTSARVDGAPTAEYQAGAVGVAQQPALPSSPAPYRQVTVTEPAYASFSIRLGARILDFFFVLLVFVPVFVGVVAGIAAATDVDPLLAVLIGLYVDLGLWELAYYLVGASHGQTIGKRIVGIRVCRDDSHQRIGFWKALGRQFASILSTLVLFIGWFAPLWTPKRQTWQDSMTHTVVIHDREARLATPAVVWGFVWTLISAAAFGGLAAWGIDALEDAGYNVDYTYDLGADTEYDYDTGDYDTEYDYDTGDYDTGSEYDYDTGYEDYDSGTGSTDDSDSGDSGDGGADPAGSSDSSNPDTTFDEDHGVAATAGSYSDDSALSSGSLDSISASMRDDARSLVGSWVVQLSSSTTLVENQAGVEPMTESEILARLNGAERRYAGTSYDPLLIPSGDYNFKYSDMWVVVLDHTYSSPEAALDFCARESYPRDHCIAKLLDTSSVWDGTSKLMPQ